IWDIDARRAMRAIKLPAKVQLAKFTPDGRWVITGCSPKEESWEFRAWEARSGRPVGPVIALQGSYCVPTVCDDGRRLLLGIIRVTCERHPVNGFEDRQSAQLWDIATGKPVSKELQLETYSAPSLYGKETPRLWTAARFSPDGNHVLVVGSGIAGNWGPKTAF